MKYIFLILILLIAVFSCKQKKLENKGFQVSEISTDDDGKEVVGLPIDSLVLETRPRNVLLTNNPNHRLTPIYKVNYDKRSGEPFVGSNNFHSNWDFGDRAGNNWHHNFMPGFEAVYGYNFVNVSHYDNERHKQNEFFKKPVLIKTLYYPASSKDTLNYQPVNRDFYMVSVYDEDTNGDGFISVKDLRRFYLFDLNGNLQSALVPTSYSVMSSEYDPANDFMYIFARLDENKNGQMEQEESTHIFWIDLKNPENTGYQYRN